MKDSILEGAANSAPVQSKSNSPSGSVKEAKGNKANMKIVSYSNVDNNPSSVKDCPIGLNNKK